MSSSFEAAVSHAMIYEVGGHWNLDVPGVRQGLIGTKEQKRAVGYVNDPLDLGGETKFGVAKNANPDLDIAALTWDAAKRVYERRYWMAAHCDAISDTMPRLAVLHFDGAVNHGLGRAAKFLQRAAGTTVDGDIGPSTMTAINAGNEIALCNAVCDQREKFYRDIVASKPEQTRFLNGWLRRIAEMRAFVTDTSRTFT
jgi:lysozyme family protein